MSLTSVVILIGLTRKIQQFIEVRLSEFLPYAVVGIKTSKHLMETFAAKHLSIKINIPNVS